jgi:hypothetical protein
VTFNDLVFPLGYQSQYTSSASKAKDPKNEVAVEDAARNGWVCLKTITYATNLNCDVIVVTILIFSA